MKHDIGTIFIEDMTVGLARSMSKVIGLHEIALFAEVSEDRNPVHMDEDHAKTTIFKGRIAHGMLSASLFSAVIGERLPGHGTIYLSQNLRFTAPVRPGDEVTVTVTVSEINLAKGRVSLDCVAKVGDTVVIKGDALVLAPRHT
jgi:3-hydroxybutyryl-CoA dehydratase